MQNYMMVLLGQALSILATTINVPQSIVHTGDADNLIQFTTDTQTFQTGGSTRMDITDSGVQFGGSGARITTVLDEDDLSSDSATALATQQSIKAYVDAAGVKNTGGNKLTQFEALVVTENAGAATTSVDVDADAILLRTAGGVEYRATSVNLTAAITSSGANGLDTGSEASSTWYYIWVIYNGSTVASLLFCLTDCCCCS